MAGSVRRCAGYRGSRGAQGGAVGDETSVHEAPQGDEQAPGQGDDADATQAPAPVPEPLLEPLTQGAVRLIAQPSPGNLNEHPAHVAIAGLADALFVAGPVAGVGGGRETDQGAGFPAVAQLPPSKDLL